MYYNNLRSHQDESQKASLCPLAGAKRQVRGEKEPKAVPMGAFLLLFRAARYGFILDVPHQSSRI